MRFLHLGDLHLGKSLGNFDLIEDQKYILDQILKVIDDKNIEVALIAGDIYDRAIPSEAATKLLNDFLYSLAKKKIKTYIISGNHDSEERLNYGSSLFESNQIFISAKYNGILTKYILTDNQNEINMYLLPFVKASQVKAYFPDADIKSYDDAIRTVFEHADLDKEKCNILVAHQFVAGREADPVLGGSESAGTQSVGLVEKVGYDCFDAFDYVALGHIHSHQKVGREEICYSGSPLKYSFSEVNNEKTVSIITVGGKGEVKIELVPLKPKRDMRHLKGRMEDLLNQKNVRSPKDFIYVTLTDENVIDNAMGIFQQVYPNTIKIDYDNSHTREIEQIDISNIAENKSFPELIRDFYELMYQCEISKEEMDIMCEIAREAGVTNETN